MEFTMPLPEMVTIGPVVVAVLVIAVSLVMVGLVARAAAVIGVTLLAPLDYMDITQVLLDPLLLIKELEEMQEPTQVAEEAEPDTRQLDMATQEDLGLW